jgi:hypothetical protein
METELETERALEPRTVGRVRRLVLLLACGLLAVLALPTAAHAARGLTTGFQSDNYQSIDPATRDFWLKKTVDAGAGIIRINIPWLEIAPTPPANPSDPNTYNLSLIDDAVRDAKAHGLEVMLITSGAPPWAEGPGKPADAVAGSWRPNPAAYADFVKALAARYSGNFDPDGPAGQPALPAVQALEVWNEPNTSGAISPVYEGKTDVAAAIFRDLLNAAYDAVKSVNPKMQVITGGTAPYGDPPGGPYPPGIQRAQPVSFWQDVLCVQAVKTKKKKGKKAAPRYVRKGGCNGPVKFDVLAHHAIDNTGKGPLQHGPLPGDSSTPDLGRVTRVLRGAEKAGTTLSGKHQIWVTEFWWDSKPPNPSGAKLATQARWIQQSLYLFWKAGASKAFNFVIGDVPVRPTVHAGFQGGVYFQDGRPKPSLTAIRFPFVTDQISKRNLRAWGKAPESGKLVIQRRQGSRWATVKKLRVSKGAVFLTNLKLSGKQRLRAIVGNSRSLVWKQTAAASKSSGDGGGISKRTGVLLVLGGLVLTLVAAGVLRRRQVVRRRRIRRSRRPQSDRLSSSTAT